MNITDIKNEAKKSLSQILQGFVEGEKRADDVARYTGVSKSQAYRYISGDGEPDFSSVCALVRLCGDDELRMAIAELLLAATGLKVINDAEGGGASKQAIMANAFNASERAVTFTRKIERAVSDGVVTPSETVDIRRTWDQVKADGDAAVLGAEKMSERGFRIGGVG